MKPTPFFYAFAFCLFVVHPQAIASSSSQAHESNVASQAPPPTRTPQTTAKKPKPKPKAPPPPISSTRYIVGGIVGSLVGFGIGHGITGHFYRSGWIFTTGQLLSLAIPVATAFGIILSTLSGTITASGGELISNWAISLYIGLSLYAAFRIWEIFDLWWRPKVVWPKKSVSPSQSDTSTTPPAATHVAILPYIPPHGGMGLAVGGTF